MKRSPYLVDGHPTSSVPPAREGERHRSLAEMADELASHDRRSSAKTNRLLSTPNSSQTNGSGTRMPAEVIRESVMPPIYRPIAKTSRHYAREQWRCAIPEQVRWETGEQQAAYRSLLSVVGPLTRGRISDQLEWPNSRAVRWQQFFALAGALVKCGGVYRWAWEIGAREETGT